jgi:biotin carboxyl carrier protein
MANGGEAGRAVVKVIVSAGQQTLEVELREAGGATTGLDAPVDVRRVRDGLYSVLIDGRSHEVVLEGQGTAGVSTRGDADYLATVDGLTASLRAADARLRALEGANVGRSGGPATADLVVAAPMPGKVVAVLVEPGTVVAKGQTVVVLEAMKMESALAAPRDGTVAEVLVNPGQTVQQRQVLARIEPT